MLGRFITLVCRVLFIASFLMTGIAVFEKLVNFAGFTLTRGYYSNWQLMEFSAIGLLFVMALQLREIKTKIAMK